jgi:hypothetical protein
MPGRAFPVEKIINLLAPQAGHAVTRLNPCLESPSIEQRRESNEQHHPNVLAFSSNPSHFLDYISSEMQDR